MLRLSNNSLIIAVLNEAQYSGKIVSTAFPFKQIKLVNINATDIADGRPSIVLGLMWTIILYFQVLYSILSFA